MAKIKEAGINTRIVELEKMVLLHSAKILFKVLEIYCCQSAMEIAPLIKGKSQCLKSVSNRYKIIKMLNSRNVE